MYVVSNMYVCMYVCVIGDAPAGRDLRDAESERRGADEEVLLADAEHPR